nr:translation initiation factor IF-2 [Macaca fascicularis]
MEAPSGCTIAQKGSQGQHRPPSCSNHKVGRQGSAQPRRELRALSRLAASQRLQQPEPELSAATTTKRGGEGEQGPDETPRQKTGGRRGARLTTAPREWRGSFPLAAAHTSSPRGGGARPCCRTVPSRAVEPPPRGAREPRARLGGLGSPGGRRCGAGESRFLPGLTRSQPPPPGHNIFMGTVARHAPLCRAQTPQTPQLPSAAATSRLPAVQLRARGVHNRLPRIKRQR